MTSARIGKSEKQNREGTVACRMCIVSRCIRPRDDLIRFVRSPEGKIFADLKESLPGRGVWVTADSSHVACAVERKLFQKGFGQPVFIEVDFMQQVVVQLRNYALSLLSLSKKAGLVVSGFGRLGEEMESEARFPASLGKNGVFLLLSAEESSLREREKLSSLLREKGCVNFLNFFSASELGDCLGKEHVVYVGLRAHPLTNMFLLAAMRCRNYETSGAEQKIPVQRRRQKHTEPG